MTTATSYSNLVQDLYVAYFGRPADYFGLQSFEAALAAADAPTKAAGLSAAYSTNAAVKSLVDSFGTSAESTALYGSGSAASFVNAIFENLFNRPAAVTGLSFWVNAIDSGQVSPGEAALSILAGAYANISQQGVADQNTINNKVAVATAFTTDLGASSTDIVAYHGSDAAAEARLLLSGVTGATDTTAYDVQTTIDAIVAADNTNTYTLTTGVDTIAGGPGNDVFNATLGGSAPTLQSFDSITGGTLANTLNIADFGTGGTMALPSGATITGITTLNISSLEAVGGDFSGWSTLNTLNVKSAMGGITLDVGNDTVVNVTNNDSGNVSINGGSVITVNQDYAVGLVDVTAAAGATALTVNGGASVTAADGNWGSAGQTLATVSLTNIGSDGATIDSDALSTLNIVNSTGGTFTVETDAHAATRTLNVTLAGDTGVMVEDNQAGTITVNAATTASDYDAISSTSATALVLNNSVDASYEVFETPNVKTVTITGTGAFVVEYLELATDGAIDASGSSGMLQVDMASVWGADPTQSFIGGTGQDEVAIDATQTGTIVGGSAHDNIIVLASIGDPENATEAAFASVSNFQTLEVGNQVYGTFNMAHLQGQAYTGFGVEDETAGNVTFYNVTPSSSLSLDIQGDIAYTVELDTADKAGASESVTLTIGSDTYGLATIAQLTLSDVQQDGIGTINAVADSSDSTDVNEIDVLADTGLLALNISGDAQLQIDSLTITGTSLAIGNNAVWLGFEDLNASHLTLLTFTGTGDDFIENMETSASSLTITNNGTGSVIIASLNADNLASPTFTQSPGSHDMSVTVQDIVALPLSSLTLNGDVAVYIGNDVVTTGATINGGTDDAAVSFYGEGGGASGVTDSVTLGNGDDVVFYDGGVAGSAETVVLGNGNDQVITLSAGGLNVTVGNGNDTIDAYGVSNLHVTAGNGTNTIFAEAPATIGITAGSGANNISLGEYASGTVTLGAHSATTADVISVGESGTGGATTPLIAISGLNNGTNGAGADQIVFLGDSLAAVAGVLTLTSAQVLANGGDTTSLAAWVAAADGTAFNAAAHDVVTFQFQGNTYLLETVYGAASDAGGPVAQNTLVELTGTGYTFAHTGLGTVGGHASITLMG